jgi:signal transduction histidine kinase
VARKRAIAKDSGFTVLVVDDQRATLESTRLVLEREGHHVLLAESGAQALELFAQHPIHLLLVDYFMPRMTGEELIAEIRRVDANVQIVLQTGYAGEKPPREMLRHLDIQGYHDKTDGPEKLLVWVDVALKASEQLQRVREAELLKSELLANVSHEFRTPLNVVLGYTEVLHEEHVGDAATQETLGRIRSNSLSLLRLIDDFLQLSDLDAGVTTTYAEALDWRRLQTELAISLVHFVRDKPVEVCWTLPDDLPAIAADPAKLRIIILNLLSNAAKFTTTGRIEIVAKADPDAVTLAVHDTGIGIAPEHHERIFESFRQVDGSDRRRHGGTGIGLPIARKLARLMGGDIAVASQPGRGSTFSIHLPRGGEPATAPSDGTARLPTP